MKPTLNQLIQSAPASPGVYLMKNTKGRIIYIGKAKNLRKRLANYARDEGDRAGRHNDIKTAILIDHIHSLETIVTQNEKEALVPESLSLGVHR